MICSQNEIKYYNDFQLANFNTLKIKSVAKYFYIPDNYGEMISLFKKFRKNSPIVLGNGSNVLFSSQGVDNPIIYTGKIQNIICFNGILEAECGIKTQALAKFCLEKKLTGLEFLIGIPATLGGAIYMNAGAHQSSISDKLVSVKVYDIANSKILTLKRDDLNFSYRHSVLQSNNYILLSAKFALKTGKKDEIKSKMDEYLIFRKERQPNLALPNSGSVFKNPKNSDLSAGALIDKCGFRGETIGDAQVWQNHCNFIVNKGNATSIDYTDLVFKIYTKVKEKFNVELEPEIVYIGKMTKGEKEKWKILKK